MALPRRSIAVLPRGSIAPTTVWIPELKSSVDCFTRFTDAFTKLVTAAERSVFASFAMVCMVLWLLERVLR